MRAFALGLGLIGLSLIPAAAEEAPLAKEYIVDKISLVHQKPEAMLSLLFGGQPGPLGGRPSSSLERSLLPDDIQGVLAFSQDSSLLVRGTTEGLTRLRTGIKVLDATSVWLGEERRNVVLETEHSDLGWVRAAVLALPGAGKAEVRHRKLTLDGSPAWIWLAMRITAAAEMGLIGDDAGKPEPPPK